MTGTDITLTRAELSALLEVAADKGAQRALERLGLHGDDPDDVRQDITDLRSLIDSWRGAKKGIWAAIWKAIGTAIGAAVLAFIAFRVGVDMPK